MLKIATAETEDQYRHLKEMTAEYIEWDSSRTRRLGLDSQEFLSFYYGTADEALPGVFGPPDGRLVLATHSGMAVGCGAFRRMTPDTCEMKRMFVRPEFRGMGIGRQLAETLIVAAREAGYGVMRLETTQFMEAAIALYASLGFRTCQPYYEIPKDFRQITVFMELDLAGSK